VKGSHQKAAYGRDRGPKAYEFCEGETLRRWSGFE